MFLESVPASREGIMNNKNRPVPIMCLLGSVLILFFLMSCKTTTDNTALEAEKKKVTSLNAQIKDLEDHLKKATDNAATKGPATPTVPDDIPMHPDFEWSAPIDASKFIPKLDPSGNPFLYAVFSTHQNLGVKMPNWEWYQAELTARGWTGILYAGVKTNIHAQKNGRYVSIIWDEYNYYTEEGRPSGQKWPSGGHYILYYR